MNQIEWDKYHFAFDGGLCVMCMCVCIRISFSIVTVLSSTVIIKSYVDYVVFFFMKTHFNLLRILVTFLRNLHSLPVAQCLFKDSTRQNRWHIQQSLFSCMFPDFSFSISNSSAVVPLRAKISLPVNCDNLLITQSFFFQIFTCTVISSTLLEWCGGSTQ